MHVERTDKISRRIKVLPDFRRRRMTGKVDEKMKRLHFLKGMSLLLCAAALAGCAGLQSGSLVQTGDAGSGEGERRTDSGSGFNGEDSEIGSQGDADALLDSALFEGSVLDFSEGSFQVLPIQTLDGGSMAQSAAPGMENEEDAVTVLYGDDCTFQIADIASGRADLTDAGADGVKKQTDVAVFGERLASGEIQASRILILRFSGAAETGGN